MRANHDLDHDPLLGTFSRFDDSNILLEGSRLWMPGYTELHAKRFQDRWLRGTRGQRFETPHGRDRVVRVPEFSETPRTYLEEVAGPWSRKSLTRAPPRPRSCGSRNRSRTLSAGSGQRTPALCWFGRCPDQQPGTGWSGIGVPNRAEAEETRAPVFGAQTRGVRSE